MKFKTIDNLKAAGFEGFIPVAQLKNDNSAMPQVPGVYMVVYMGKGYTRISLTWHRRFL